MEKALLVAMQVVLLFTDCSVAASVKKPSPNNSSQDCPITQQGEGCTLGLTKEQPADSCYHIFTCNPQGQSGMYWIRNGPTAGEGDNGWQQALLHVNSAWWCPCCTMHHITIFCELSR